MAHDDTKPKDDESFDNVNMHKPRSINGQSDYYEEYMTIT